MTVLPANQYADPLQVLIGKENAIEKYLKGCRGCVHLSFDASGEKFYASCNRNLKVGRKNCKKRKGESQ